MTELREAASSGGVTQLHRIISLVDAGHDPAAIKAWCEREIRKRKQQIDPGCDGQCADYECVCPIAAVADHGAETP